ncbi:DEAD/DEAH box helicase family protein [uncultured Adlercreutzia sp.]|uniref:DEAD/DEAH box helicase family protein n=1 Tax=uncultured Adlercreutzia sp. TaxID=875803 RepID=UPI0025E4974F|nr:DEAD/DEAH box helicase family protein [uncultured Adlercreutzia sp.]
MSGFLTNVIMSGGDWRAFERMPARVLSHLGWRDIQIIGEAGDKGGDILAIDPSGKTWVIQAKSVTGDRLVGHAAIEEALNAMCAYNADAIAIATNGNFTHSAKIRRDELNNEGFEVKLWNGAWFRQLFDKLPYLSKSRKNPLNYQKRVINKLENVYNEDARRALFIMATGLGKTVTAATAAQYFWEQGARRILVLCHLQDLALQLEQSFWTQLGKDVPTTTFYEGAVPSTREGVAFGLFQTLQNWLPSLDSDSYDVVIVDEAHHALSSAFSTCLRYLKPRLLVGMTATPWRGDGRQLELLFGTTLDSISLVDGMKMGYLARVDYRVYCDNIDWEQIPSISKKRLTIRDLNKKLFLPQRDDAIIDGIHEVCREFETPRIAVFSPSITHSQRFAEMLTQSGIDCVPLSGVEKVQRRANLLAFSSGKINAVTAVDVLNEGIDIPDINILVFLRATHSRRIFLQQLGRGLRLSKNKDKAVVLDYVSDIRRIAYAIEIDHEAREKDKETLVFRDSLVSFTNEKMGEFVNAWLEDVASSEYDEHQELYFPGLG